VGLCSTVNFKVAVEDNTHGIKHNTTLTGYSAAEIYL